MEPPHLRNEVILTSAWTVGGGSRPQEDVHVEGTTSVCFLRHVVYQLSCHLLVTIKECSRNRQHRYDTDGVNDRPVGFLGPYIHRIRSGKEQLSFHGTSVRLNL